MSVPHNAVFIATSLDGYIAGRDGDLSWLDIIPNPQGIDMGYHAFLDRTDAILMGRNSYETVLGFGIDWPYQKPVFVWSHTLKDVPDDLRGKVFLVQGTPTEILTEIHNAGHHRLYIDGGRTIQSFLSEDLIDEMIITTIPVLLGLGTPLFGPLEEIRQFTCVSSEIFLDAVTQSRYIRHDNDQGKTLW